MITIKDNVATINNVNYVANEAKEFMYKGECYIIYNNTLSLRKHENACDFDTKLFKIPFIIKKNDALRIIQYVINLSNYNLEIIDSNSKKPICNNNVEGTFMQIKNELTELALNQKDSINEFQDSLNLLISMCSNLTSTDVIKGIFENNIEKFTLELDTTLPTAIIMEKMLEYITNYRSYNESIVQIRSLNSSLDFMYTITYILSLFYSEISNDLYTNTNDLIIHSILEILYDTITDRCTYELFIKEKSSVAADIKQKYLKKYRFLSSPNIDMSKVANSSLISELENEKVVMYPYILTISMPNMARIKFLYNHFYKNKNKIPLTKEGVWMSEKEFVDTLRLFWDPLKKDYGKYNVDILVTLTPHLIKMFPTDGKQTITVPDQIEDMDIN